MISFPYFQQTNSSQKYKHNMIIKISFVSLFLALLFTSSGASRVHRSTSQDFINCLHSSNSSISQITYTPNTPTYTSILQLKLNNPRFATPSTPRPFLIITPNDESQVQTVIYCSNKHGAEMRIRGGGHDSEGLSYTANVPFFILDLINMRSITIDAASKTAWVQGGASLGELYYRISQASNKLAFPAGDCPTVGVGGHISGGGYGTLMRKYGLAADNVLDVRMINQYGQILDRRSMGEDLFWAVRGGGASSFGVIVQWKLRLVDVPEVVTVFAVRKTLEQNGTNIFHKWQSFAPSADKDLYFRTQFTTINQTVSFTFDGLFLGRASRVISLIQTSFPELGLVPSDCSEVSWIQSALVLGGFSSDTPPQIFLNRTAAPRFPLKIKTDYVVKPIPVKGLEGMWEMLFRTDMRTPIFLLNPYGGRMNEISESATPFPHRAGNLYLMQQMVLVDPSSTSVTNTRIGWITSFHRYIAPYVSKSPRRAYVNYNDLDLGVSAKTYAHARGWGARYFSGNFERLVRVKSKVDPENFFSHPQSIPPFPSKF